MKRKREIVIDMDKRCQKCKRKGASANGLCMNCISLALGFAVAKSIADQIETQDAY